MLLNDGSGVFTISDGFETQQAALSVSTGQAMADFDGDGNPDFAVITPMIGIERCGPNDFWRSIVSVAFGDGLGGIDHVDTLSVCGTAYNMGLADVDNDNALDIVVANASERRMEVFLADGLGWFGPGELVSLETDSLTHALSLADVDNDGNADAIAGGGVVWGDNIIVALNTAEDPPMLDKSISVIGFANVTLSVTEPNERIISRNYLSAPSGGYIRRDVDADGFLDETAVDRLSQYGEYILTIRTRGEAGVGETFDAEIELGDGQTAVLFRDYPVPATSKSGGRILSDSIVFHYALEDVSPVVPANGGRSNGQSPSFDWRRLVPSGVSAESYRFQLDETYDFSSGDMIEDVGSLTVPEFSTGSVLTVGDVYYWRVSWYADGSWSEFTPAYAVLVTEFLCGDINGNGSGPDVTDLTYLVDFQFRGGPMPPNPAAADVNGNGEINVSDLSALVDYLFRAGPALNCAE
jgi:hypothetical protein